MSDYRQQQENEEWHRWTLEVGLTRMQKDVERGRALLKELEGERKRNTQETNEHEIPSESDC